jgi:hypothetical protein
VALLRRLSIRSIPWGKSIAANDVNKFRGREAENPVMSQSKMNPENALREVKIASAGFISHVQAVAQWCVIRVRHFAVRQQAKKAEIDLGVAMFKISVGDSRLLSDCAAASADTDAHDRRKRLQTAFIRLAASASAANTSPTIAIELDRVRSTRPALSKNVAELNRVTATVRSPKPSAAIVAGAYGIVIVVCFLLSSLFRSAPVTNQVIERPEREPFRFQDQP